MADRRPLIVLAVLAVLLLIAASLLSRGSADVVVASDGGVTKAPRKERVIYPRDKKRVRVTRQIDDTRPAEERKRALDGLQRSVLADDGKGAVFIEANAIRHSPLMEKILRCRQDEATGGLQQMKEELGIDPLEDLDRVGFNGEVFAASGFFQNMKVPEEVGPGESYGDKAKLWRMQGDDGGSVVFAQVDNGLLLSGADEASVKRAVDRAEGRAPSSPTPPAGLGEAELYGTLPGAFLQELAGGTKDPTAARIAELVVSSSVRMNVGTDAALSLDVATKDEASSEELEKTINGGLALVRARAEQQGERDVAVMLDQARVERAEGGGLMLDVAVPGEFLLKTMGCGPDGTPLAGAKPKGQAQVAR
ncbi:MAG: hypothetical protein HYS27_03530 [Deltaproteobacteria bacterium]|nr:hypothetical protein [Deltaproteobacteria bacterium]